MLDDIKKPVAPSPPTAFTRTSTETTTDKSPNRPDKLTPIDKHEASQSSMSKFSSVVEKSSSSSIEKSEEKSMSAGTLERRLHALKTEKPADAADRGAEVLIAQLNSRVSLPALFCIT